ncbi:hypothetical protein ACOSQ3_024244 [Xanthoceras sorbifolium]
MFLIRLNEEVDATSAHEFDSQPQVYVVFILRFSFSQFFILIEEEEEEEEEEGFFSLQSENLSGTMRWCTCTRSISFACISFFVGCTIQQCLQCTKDFFQI